MEKPGSCRKNHGNKTEHEMNHCERNLNESRLYDSRPPVILLTAGKSTRMGKTKALLSYDNGNTFVSTILETCRQCHLYTVVVRRPDQRGLATELEQIKKRQKKKGEVTFREAVNPKANSEMVDSFYRGLIALEEMKTGPKPQTSGAFIWPVDAPGVSPQTLALLTQEACRKTGALVVPSYQGVKGHPSFLPVSLIQLLLKTPLKNGVLPLERGIHTLLSRLQPRRKEVEVPDPMVCVNFNRPEDLHELPRNRKKDI